MSTIYTVRALVKGVNGDLTLDEKPEDEKKTEVRLKDFIRISKDH